MTAALSQLGGFLFVGTQQVDPERVSLALDEAWSPFASADVTFRYDATLAAALDPRTSPRVQVQLTRSWFASLTLADLTRQWAGLTLANLSTAWAGLTLANLSTAWSKPWDSGLRADDTITADLVVRSRSIDYAADTITIRCASDEALTQDIAVGDVALPLEPLPNRLYRLLALAGVTVTAADFTAGAPFIAMPAEITRWSETIWEAASRLCASVGLRLLCDHTRTWRLVDPAPAPATTVTLDHVQAAEDVTNRDGDYANVLVWVGKGVDSTGVSFTDTDVYPIPLPASPRVKVVEKDYGTIGAGVPMPTTAELAGRLALLNSQARTLGITAPADPTVRPGVALHTGLPSLPALSAIAARVAWDLPANTMTVTTRATEA